MRLQLIAQQTKSNAWSSEYRVQILRHREEVLLGLHQCFTQMMRMAVFTIESQGNGFSIDVLIKRGRRSIGHCIVRALCF